jgi:uncharacterized protein with HEPN domain
MLDAARQAADFIRGRTRADLDTEPMLQHSLVRLLEIIGEAARGVSAEGRAAHPQLPWRRMVGMRDRLIHGYFDVDLDVVWQTVTEDLPPLIGQLEAALQ